MTFTDKELNILYKLLTNCIDREFQSKEFYSRLAGLTSLRELRKVLYTLAAEEKKHIDYLKHIFNNIFKSAVYQLDDLAKHILILESNSKTFELPSVKNIAELAKFAIAEENKTVQFYRSLKDKFNGYNAVREILYELIKNEEEHKITIAKIIIEYQGKIQRFNFIKKILMFDLDGTLVNSEHNGKISEYYLRPNAANFLSAMKKKYLLCLFSRSDFKYIRHTAQICGISEYFEYYFDRDFLVDGKKKINHLIKRFNLPDFMSRKIIVIEDNYTVTPIENMIKIHSYTGDKNDKLFLTDSLEKLIESGFEKLEAGYKTL